MMGQREGGQRQFFYAFDLDKVVPLDHLVRQIDAVLDLNWVHKELAPYYSHTGRPSIDPVFMIRMLIVGYAFAIRSERRRWRSSRPHLQRQCSAGRIAVDADVDLPAPARSHGHIWLCRNA